MTHRSETEWRNWLERLRRREPQKSRYINFYRLLDGDVPSPRIVGPAQALEWCFSGRVFDGEEALRGRLVSKVVAGSDLMPAARALAREIADNSAPVSVALMRQMDLAHACADHPIEAHKIDSRGMFERGKARTCAKASWLFLKSGRRSFPIRYQWTRHHTIRGGRNAAMHSRGSTRPRCAGDRVPPDCGSRANQSKNRTTPSPA
jgi:hypothetical protein